LKIIFSDVVPEEVEGFILIEKTPKVSTLVKGILVKEVTSFCKADYCEFVCK
jgi:hypothetical protein